MLNMLMYISNILIIISFISYFIMIFVGRNVKVTNSNGFDVTKDIISEYNSINVIESKNYFSVYNIKRKVIKLSNMCYYGNKLSDISLSLIEAGISVIDNKKNTYIEMFRKAFSNLKVLYLLPLVGILINNVTYNVSDVRVSIIFIIIFIFIAYMLIDIKSQVSVWICESLDKIKDISKDNCLKIKKFINKMMWLDKFIFFGELIMIIRFVAILLEFN